VDEQIDDFVFGDAAVKGDSELPAKGSRVPSAAAMATETRAQLRSSAVRVQESPKVRTVASRRKSAPEAGSPGASGSTRAWPSRRSAVASARCSWSRSFMMSVCSQWRRDNGVMSHWTLRMVQAGSRTLPVIALERVPVSRAG
jgi:hypothetical protein